MYNTLARCPLFRGMSEEQIRRVLDGRDYSVETYSAGDVIARKDSAYSGLMIMLRGRAIGEMSDPSGGKLRTDALEASQLIAPAFLFGGCNRLPVDVVAETDVEILTLHRGLLFELMQDDTLILSNFIDIISDRADVWARRIYFLSFKSLKEKLASYLLERSSGSQPVVPVPDIALTADYFGATRSSLLSVIADLEKKKVLATEGGNIRILNRTALENLLK